MSLRIHRAERADRLAMALGDLLRTPLADPFATEFVSVPTRGVERWLSQNLAQCLGTSPDRFDGVCAGVSFPSPRRLTALALAEVSSVDPAADPWEPHRAVWPLLAVIDGARGQEWASLLWSYLGDRREPPERVLGAAHPFIDDPAAGGGSVALDPIRGGRRWSTARHLADLFEAYGSVRPTMVLGWLDGQDADADGAALPADVAWQAELWRRLRAELGSPSPAERLPAACAELVAQPARAPLPHRISMFGATRLDPQHQAVLRALAEHRDVHLWLTHASPALWEATAVRLRSQPQLAGPRRHDPTAALPRHRLLGYLGRDSRELQVALMSADPPGEDTHHPPAAPTGSLTLLSRLQADLMADCPLLVPAERPMLREGERSVAFHASHGPDRQVEVLRELLVGLLADDPTLEPRDIIVMCPDIETFAPLISATFGLDSPDGEPEHPGHRLRVRLADRSLRRINPILSALSRLLEMTDSRLVAADLLDFCASAPVARKFGFSDDDLERLGDLIVRSGVRWGLDPHHRAAFQMAGFAQNTWLSGLDRLLLGVTMDEEGQHFIGTTLPLDDIDSSDVDLVGRIAECLDRIRACVAASRGRQSLAAWVAVCKHAIEWLMDVSVADNWQIGHAYGELSALADAARDDHGTELMLTEVRSLLADSFRGRASRANFRTGTLTMCTMMPMRSVPHRVVCLLGVDDGVFPRHNTVDGDDILAFEPWIGDRDPRSEDRQLLLDAIMAAEDHLIVIYSGADPRTGVQQPPAVPIGELLDVLDQTASTPDGRPVRDFILTRHPLQPFDPGNFTTDNPEPQSAGAHAEPFSFDRSSLRGARVAARARTRPRPRFDVEPLDEAILGGTIALPDLIRFFNHPVKALLRARGGLFMFSEDDPPAVQIPVGLDPLESWAMGDRLLRLHLSGGDLDQLAAAEWRRGHLPPRSFGDRTLAPVLDNVRQLAANAQPLMAAERTTVDVSVAVGDHVVAGTIASVYGDQLVTINYSWLGPKHRLQAWIELLTLTATHPDTDWTAVTLGRGRRSVLGPVPAAWAVPVLADLVDLYRTGLREPLPLGPKASAEYARVRFEDKSVTVLKEKIEQAWAEDRDPAYEQFFGEGVTLDQVWQTPSVRAEERGPLGEPSRFGTLARRVWHPLLSSEQLS